MNKMHSKPGTLDLVLSVEWPFPALVDIPAEDRPQVAMHIARAFREEAQRWEEQAFRLAVEQEVPRRLVPISRPSIPAGDRHQKSKVYGTDR